MNFFIAGKREVKSITMAKNKSANYAASLVESMNSKKLDKVDVINYDDFGYLYISGSQTSLGSLYQTRSNDYIIQESDIV
jgi:ribosome-binding ATPase YchF (GTP1/OBG family)